MAIGQREGVIPGQLAAASWSPIKSTIGPIEGNDDLSIRQNCSCGNAVLCRMWMQHLEPKARFPWRLHPEDFRTLESASLPGSIDDHVQVSGACSALMSSHRKPCQSAEPT